MTGRDDEEELLRSVALQNAKAILLARQQSEQDLLQAHGALGQKTAELAQSLAMMRATLEATTDGILVTDAAGRITGFNEKYVSMWRLPRAVIDAGSHHAVLDAVAGQFSDAHTFRERVLEIYATSPAESYDLLELADGRVFERFSRPQVVDGRNVGRVWSFRDITGQRRAEEAQGRLAAIVESSQDVIISKSLDGTIRSWNREAERVFGYRADEAIGQPITLIIPADRQDEERDIMARLRRGERVEHFETVRRAKDGRLVELSIAISPIRDAAGRVIGASKAARDISERKKIEEALRTADRRKDEFLAVLAHELRNPLAPLANGLQVIRLAPGDARAVAQARTMMERQLAHLVRLVDDLLDVSRISRSKMELRRSRLLLSDVLNSAIETARPLIEAAKHTLTVSIPPEPIHLDGDLTRLSQVFSNLLTNSAKYTDARGQIFLEVIPRSGEVVVSVRDTGIGIAADQLEAVFGMFSQIDPRIERSGGGLGIGLALVKGLVKMHGGSVTAQSPGRGRGSTFSVTLPVIETTAAAQRSEPAESSSVSHQKRRILVVDDNLDASTSMAMMLELMGNEVFTAHDGLQAIERAERDRPDVVLMDVGMPRMDGYEATRLIRARPWGRTIVIIALTGWGQDEDKARSHEAGCDGHLTKPVNLPDLESLLESLQSAD
jgi:PAS domain S-box-containing protein